MDGYHLALKTGHGHIDVSISIEVSHRQRARPRNLPMHLSTQKPTLSVIHQPRDVGRCRGFLVRSERNHISITIIVQIDGCQVIHENERHIQCGRKHQIPCSVIQQHDELPKVKNHIGPLIRIHVRHDHLDRCTEGR